MRLNLALIIGLVFEFLIAVLAAGGYFFYYIKMPEYSMHEARKAMQAGNYHEFEKYVDVARITNDATKDLSIYIPADDAALQSMYKSGQLSTLIQNDVEEYIKNGKWGKSPGLETPQAQALILDSGMKTWYYRGLQYLHKGIDPMVTPAGTTEPVEVHRDTIDSILDKVDHVVTKIEAFMGFVEEAQNGIENLDGLRLPITEEGYTGEVAEAGIGIYDDSIGETVVLRIKLMEKTDGSWRAVNVANYGEFVDRMVKMHKREMKRYVNRINDILLDTDKDLEEYRKEHPNTDKDWVLAATDIMKKYNEKIELIDVPRSGNALAELLKERKTIFFDMMDVYYDSNERKKPKNIDARIEEVNRRWMENRKAIQEIISQYKDLNV